jgi:hypothetical protein
MRWWHCSAAICILTKLGSLHRLTRSALQIGNPIDLDLKTIQAIFIKQDQ